ncbi:MAG: lytic murein transglycosylase [Sphingomicrobium sp.]
MAFRTVLAATVMWASAATAQTDPLAPLPDAPPPLVRVQTVLPQYRPVSPAPVTALTGFAAYKQVLSARARSAGVREATIQATIPYLSLNSRAISLDRGQPGGVNNPNTIPPFAPYRRQHVTSSLIRRGQARFDAYAARLAAIERRFGVEPQVLMAIYGHETSYGTVTGSFDLLGALASLAYEGRRRPLFESEFIAALQLLDRGTPRDRLKGSWAGATGYPQFMPSAVLRLAVDGDGDGTANIWRSEADGLASIANYLRDAGWKPNVHWGIPVRVPSTLNRAAIVSRLTAPRCAPVYKRHSQWKTMREWRALGIVTMGRSLPEAEMATLIEPDGPYATAYLLSTNYRAILDYNCSNFYALSVGLLADGIAAR